jgi:hypothetical protein
MGKTTFSGPIVSQAGFISGNEGAIAAVTAATLAVTSEAHNGKIIPLSKADGITVTLPASSGSMDVYKFRIDTSITSNGYIIQVANATDTMIGHAAVAATTGGVFSPTAAGDTMTMSSTTTGGLAGGWIEITDVKSGKWLVNAGLVGSGTAATPFSAAVN